MKIIRDYLADIADNEILTSKPYSVRIEIKDGGINSYIGCRVGTDDYNRKIPVTQDIELFRHTNSKEHLINTWRFRLGNCTHLYAENHDIPLEYSSYGKSKEAAEREANEYLAEIKKLIRKQTSIYKIQAAKEVEKERNELIARLNELNGNMQPPVSDQ